MRNYLKKISALLLAFAMIMGMCMTVLAASGYTTTVEIENKSDEATSTDYYYLQIIEPDTSSSLGWKFVDYTFTNNSKTIAEVVMSALGVSTEEDALKALIGATDESDDIQKAIKAVADAATLDDMTQLTAKAGTLSIDDTSGTATITLSDAGLYYIKAVASGVAYNPMAVYVEYTYNSTTGEVTGLKSNYDLGAKSTSIPVEKTNTDNSGTANDGNVQIGSTVTYTITSKVPYISLAESNRQFYVTDKIVGAEYTDNGDGYVYFTVAIDGTTLSGTYRATIEDDTQTGGQKFTLYFNDLIKDNNTYAGKTITITYTATVTAVTANNTAEVLREPGGSYGSETSTVTTGQITLTKTREDNEPLEDAVFVVYRDNSGTKEYLKVDTTSGAYSWITVAANQTPVEAGATTFTTNENGKITVTGLDKTYTYWFEEIEAPDGYSLNTTEDAGKQGSWSTSVNSDGVYTATASMTDTKLSSLPSTGGLGTYLFTIIGVVVMAVMASLYFIKRRRDAAE